jgi:hypothetical protein
MAHAKEVYTARPQAASAARQSGYHMEADWRQLAIGNSAYFCAFSKPSGKMRSPFRFGR